MSLAQLTLHEASDKLRKREITSVELTEAVNRSLVGFEQWIDMMLGETKR